MLESYTAIFLRLVWWKINRVDCKWFLVYSKSRAWNSWMTISNPACSQMITPWMFCILLSIRSQKQSRFCIMLKLNICKSWNKTDLSVSDCITLTNCSVRNCDTYWIRFTLLTSSMSTSKSFNYEERELKLLTGPAQQLIQQQGAETVHQFTAALRAVFQHDPLMQVRQQRDFLFFRNEANLFIVCNKNKSHLLAVDAAFVPVPVAASERRSSSENSSSKSLSSYQERVFERYLVLVAFGSMFAFNGAAIGKTSPGSEQVSYKWSASWAFFDRTKSGYLV